MQQERSTSAHSARAAFSLIEIIIATAILMGSVGVLARLAGMGRSMAQKSDLMADAQRICERTMNEIVLGERPLLFVDRAVLEPVVQIETSSDVPSIDSNVRVDSPRQRWLHSIAVTPLQGMPELVRVTVTVEPEPDATMDAVSQPVDGAAELRRDKFTLSRWIRARADGNGISPDVLNIAGGP
jgi:type II secretory pathway pseudopilin PulG